jgi:hypothetical protein
MKKYSSPVWMISLITTSFLFSACSKINQDCSDVGKYCRIESLDVDLYGSGQPWHIQFFYNAAGDPLETRLMNGLYGNDNHFRYDRKGRLSDVLATDPGQTFVYIWDRYSYPSPRLIIDSTYEYQGNVNDPNPPNYPDLSVRITKMQLDELGRPVKFLTYYSDGGIPPSTFELSYDARGNLVSPNAVYDDKVNIYRTSKVWQLLYLDYSRNNRVGGGGMTGLPVTPNAYNAYGLPTKFLGPFVWIFGYSFYTMNVTYSCDVPAGMAK